MSNNAAKGISTFLKVLAGLTFLCSLIIGIVLGRDSRGDFAFVAALEYWLNGLISGMILLAISAIIDLQLRILNKESTPEGKRIDFAPKKTGVCQFCGKDNAGLYSVKIVDSLGTRYRDLCEECVEKTDNCTVLE